MATQNAQDCAMHAGQGNVANRADLDPVMRSLPKNQAESGRHRCPYCAYQAGYCAGYQAALERAGEVIANLESAPNVQPENRLP